MRPAWLKKSGYPDLKRNGFCDTIHEVSTEEMVEIYERMLPDGLHGYL